MVVSLLKPSRIPRRPYTVVPFLKPVPFLKREYTVEFRDDNRTPLAENGENGIFWKKRKDLINLLQSE